MSAASPAIPEGFELMPAFGQFHDLVGPIYFRDTENGGCVVGLQLEDRHGNRGFNMHGAVLAMLVDTGFTFASRRLRNPPQPSVTISLSIDFAGAAKPGDWIEGDVEIVRWGKRMTFMSCIVSKGKGDKKENIARASGVFQAMEPKAPAAAK